MIPGQIWHVNLADLKSVVDLRLTQNGSSDLNWSGMIQRFGGPVVATNRIRPHGVTQGIQNLN